MSSGLGLGLPRRLHEIGRLRLGDKVAFEKKGGGEGTRPHKLDKWRLTSQHEAVITHVAEEYGGTPRVWEGAPAGPPQWEVYTETNSLEIYIPTGGLSAAWEMWSGGGCKRRCDGSWMDTGEQCACLVDIEKDLGSDRFKQLNASDILRERLSRAKANPPRACKPMTRLSVVLPNIPPALTIWRVTTSSVNAGIEMPGTVDLLQGALSNRQLIPAHLVIEQRTQVKEGKTTIFPVPVLSLHEVTMAELGRAGAFWVLGEANSGAAQLSAPPDRPALNAGPTVDAVSSIGGTAGASEPAMVEDLIQRVNDLKPQARMMACVKELRDAGYGFPKIDPAQLDSAATVIESYEPPTEPPPRDPPYAPPEGGGAGDRSPRPSSPPPREQSAARPEPVAASEPVEVRSAPRPAPQPPKSGQPVPAEVSGATAAVAAPSVLAQLDDALAKAPAQPPKPPVDVESTAVTSSDRPSGSPAVEGRSEGIAPQGNESYDPGDGGPRIPAGLHAWMFAEGAEAKMTQAEKGEWEKAWDLRGGSMGRRADWQRKQDGREAKPSAPLAPDEDHWEPGPVRDKSHFDKAREDLERAKERQKAKT